MTNQELIRRYRAAHGKQSALIDPLIAMGFGELRPSDMRSLQNPPLIIQEYLSLLSESSALRMEAETRYGPGLFRVEQLGHR